jgi:enterochelin esterase-like enzyme
VKVRVHYSLLGRASGETTEILLRADGDWEHDLAPRRVNRSRSRFEFELDEADYRYFKPVLRADGETRWAQGENLLALRGKDAQDVYPYFDPDSTCHVCDVHNVPSTFEARGYDLRVFLPQGYSENELERYPVLYMQDGQNLFFPDEAFAGKHWRISETLELLSKMNLVRKVIVVGVYPRDRIKEYTEPGCARYARFLAEELVPWVDARYRTVPKPAARALLGSSLGGVVSFWTGWEHPEVFGNVGAMSSTFGYENSLLERVAKERRRKLRIYLDSGYPRDNYEVTRSMRTTLERKGWLRGRDLLYVAFPEAKHNEESWAMRVHLPFQFFFGE